MIENENEPQESVVATHIDPDTGVETFKIHRLREGRGKETFYRISIGSKRIQLRRGQLFDLTDALDDLCDMIADGEF